MALSQSSGNGTEPQRVRLLPEWMVRPRTAWMDTRVQRIVDREESESRVTFWQRLRWVFTGR